MFDAMFVSSCYDACYGTAYRKVIIAIANKRLMTHWQ